jgi:hypothetical protein
VTLADAMAAVHEARGALPAGTVAVAVRKRKAEVLAAYRANPDRFVHTGKTKASRWDVREEGFTAADLASRKARWECRPEDPPCSLELAEEILAGFEKRGLVERLNGNGRVVLTERGVTLSHALESVA